MIQRKQTLFLFQLIFLNATLLFIPIASANLQNSQLPIYLIQSTSNLIVSTSGHLSAIFLNVANIILTFIVIFLFKKRELQIKLCYVLIASWIFLTALIFSCPLVKQNVEIQKTETNYFILIIALFAVIAAMFAIRFIKKDIELLKSADRIR